MTNVKAAERLLQLGSQLDIMLVVLANGMAAGHSEANCRQMANGKSYVEANNFRNSESNPEA